MNNNTIFTIIIGAVILLSGAALSLFFWKKSKMGSFKKVIVIVVTIILLIFAAMVIIDACSPKRDYYDDIRIPAEEYGGEIVIKEWSYLLGSGADVYFKRDGGKEVLLGKLSGGDNGYCPFRDGKYTANIENGVLTLEWCKFSDNNDKPWEKKSFELPLN